MTRHLSSVCLAAEICPLCHAGVKHHTNSASSIGGADRHAVTDIHAVEGAGGVGLAECLAGDMWRAAGVMTVDRYTLEMRSAWDAFCQQSPRAWFWHSRAWVDYCRAYDVTAVDDSYVIRRAGRIVAVAPFLIGRLRGEIKLGGVCGGASPVFPAAEDESAMAVAVATLAHVARLAGCDRVTLRSSPLAAEPLRGVPATTAWDDASWATRVVTLQGDLWASVRKSYRSLIHAAERKCLFLVWWNNPLGVSTISTCQDVHRQAAHRLTRSPETWRLMGDWIAKGNALAVVAYDDAGTAVAFAYWIVDRGRAYYASGASLVDDVLHAVIWRSLIELSRVGCVRAELGWQAHAVDVKGQGIEFFKRGFGGTDVPIVAATTRLIDEQGG